MFDRRAQRMRARYSVTVRLVLVLGAAALVVAACGSDSDSGDPSASSAPQTEDRPGDNSEPSDEAWQSVLSDAEEEGSLLIYSSNSPMFNDATVAAFEEEYPGIDVEVQRLAAPELIPRADTEFDTESATADVILNPVRDWVVDKIDTEGYSVALTGPNVADVGDDLVIGDQEAVVTSGVAYGFAYNTEAYPDGIEPANLTDPEFDGRIGTLEPTTETTIKNYDAYVEFYGEGWLEGIGSNSPALFSSQVPLAQAVAAGELDVSLMAVTAVLPDGAPIALEYPETPIAATFYGMATGRGASPNAGQVFMNWLLSQDGQEVWANGGVAVVSGVSSAEFTFDEVVQPDVEPIDDAYVTQRRAELTEILSG